MDWKELPKKKRLYVAVILTLVGILAWAFITAGVITHNFNRQQMADYLNVERTALSKELSRMKKDGIIDYWKNSFKLYNE